MALVGVGLERIARNGLRDRFDGVVVLAFAELLFAIELEEEPGP